MSTTEVEVDFGAQIIPDHVHRDGINHVTYRVEFHSLMGFGWVLDIEYDNYDDAQARLDEWADKHDRPARIVSIHTRTTYSLEAYHDPRNPLPEIPWG